MRWEDICRRCSLCCYERTSFPSEVVIDKSSPCRFLDVSTGLCSVYADRFRLCPECSKVTLWDAVAGDALPPGCAYIEWARRHHIRLRRDKRAVVEESL